MSKVVPSLRVAAPRFAASSLEVRFDFVGVSDAQGGEQLRRVLAIWTELGRRGAFEHSDLAPQELPKIEVTDESLSPGRYIVRLTDALVDPRAYQLLRSAAGRLALEGTEVRSVVVQEPGSAAEPARMPIPDEFNEPDVYPGFSPRIHFPVEFEDTDFSKARRLLVELQTPVAAEDVSGIDLWVEPWNEALEAGAYAMPVGLPTDFQSLRGVTQQFDEMSLELSVACYKASEMGWNGLVNCLATYARGQSLRIVRMLID